MTVTTWASSSTRRSRERSSLSIRRVVCSRRRWPGRGEQLRVARILCHVGLLANERLILPRWVKSMTLGAHTGEVVACRERRRRCASNVKRISVELTRRTTDRGAWLPVLRKNAHSVVDVLRPSYKRKREGKRQDDQTDRKPMLAQDVVAHRGWSRTKSEFTSRASWPAWLELSSRKRKHRQE